MHYSENIFSRLISPPMKTTTVWGAALERLRDGRSLRSMQTAGLIGIPQYKRMCESKLGPSIAILDRWLKGMGYTWNDWADAYEHARLDAIGQAATRPPNKKNFRSFRTGE